MSSGLHKLSAMVVALYAWSSSVFLGAVLLDITYANFLGKILDSHARAEVYSEVADLLLCLGSGVILSAIAAILFSWQAKTARTIFIASLLVILLEFIGPPLFQLVPGVTGLIPGSWLRLAIVGLASVLACSGLLAFILPRQQVI